MAVEESGQEEAWILASQNGDQLAFNRLVLKWEHKIYNLVLRMLNEPEEAAETTQEIFFAVYRNIGRFRRQAKFSTWIHRIAVNHSISRLRRRPPVHISIEEQGFAPVDKKISVPGRQEREVLRREQQVRIRNSLSTLSAEQRAVIELKIYQEETFESIAGILKIPQSTVKSRFYAGLEILKGRLRHLAEDRP
jgi:RNA polymerase sigma-70 factor (ECF subfamily)